MVHSLLSVFELWYTSNRNKRFIRNMRGADMSDLSSSDKVVVRNARLAVKNELEKKKALNQPIARFDVKTGEVYMENPDGSTTVVAHAMQQGRYSERCN